MCCRVGSTQYTPPPLLLQVCVKLDDGFDQALRSIAQRFRNATKIKVSYRDEWETRTEDADLLAACLDSLPRGCWRAVEQVVLQGEYGVCQLPARVAKHVPRLCPQLRKASVTSGWAADSGKGAALAAALEDLAAVAGTLQELDLEIVDSVGAVKTVGFAPGDVSRAATALGGLRGLRRVRVGWDTEEPLGLLRDALAPLTALSSLSVRCGDYSGQPPLQLGVVSEALTGLHLSRNDGPWSLESLRLAPQLTPWVSAEVLSCMAER